MRLKYFRDETKWGRLMSRGQALIEHLFDIYQMEAKQSNATSPSRLPPSRPKSLKKSWSDRLLELSELEPNTALHNELSRFFNYHIVY